MDSSGIIDIFLISVLVLECNKGTLPFLGVGDSLVEGRQITELVLLQLVYVLCACTLRHRHLHRQSMRTVHLW